MMQAIVRCGVATLVLALVVAWTAQADDEVWGTVEVDGVQHEIHVVSEGALPDNFPNRSLQYAVDRNPLTDVYVVDVSTGLPVDSLTAKTLVSLFQSSFRVPAVPASLLEAGSGIHDADLQTVPTSYPLQSSFYFRTEFIDDFIRTGFAGGTAGLDDWGRRSELYGELFVDMALQPDLAEDPLDEDYYQAFLDLVGGVQEFRSALGSAVSIFQTGSESEVIIWVDLEDALAALCSIKSQLLDLVPSSGATPLDQLYGVIQSIETAEGLTGNAARSLLLETLANERAMMRLRILEGFVARAAVEPGFDSALQEGIEQARVHLEDHMNGYYSNLFDVVTGAIEENPNSVGKARKISKKLVGRFLGKTAAKNFARVTGPYYYAWRVSQGIREQQDRARLASLSATLQRALFEPYGLAHHRDLMHLPSGIDGVEAQNFYELLQMSWYLSAQHYASTWRTLNNLLSRIFGEARFFFQNGIYTAQVEALGRDLSYRRLIATRMVPPAYMASVPSIYSSELQDPEYLWLMSKVRGDIVSDPTPAAQNLLGICITLPYQSGANPATLEGMNIRFEPRGCSDPDVVDPWECSVNDPDGECSARVQLFWDDNLDPNDADCENGSGPCPIAGAEDLSPKRGLFHWRAGREGLQQGDYYLYARIVDGSQMASNYSAGYYDFIDPLYEADGWHVVSSEIREGGRSDDDGIPEVGEEIQVDLMLQNTSGRDLENVKIHSLRLEGDAVRNLVADEWNPDVNPEDLTLSFILDDVVLAPDAVDGEIVAATDDFDLFIGSESSATIGLVAAVEYADPDNPVEPGLRRTQEIGFEIQVSDGSGAPDLRCDHIDVVDDTDGDGRIESGERGAFTATLCNDGTWEAQNLRGIFDSPAPLGEWRDDDSGYPDLNPTECQPSEDDYALRLEPDECGGILANMTAEFNGGSTQPFLQCPITVYCVPHQSIQDDQDAGTVAQGDPVTALISISNLGSDILTISAVTEVDGLTDLTVVSYPATLAAGSGGFVEVSIDTSVLAPGRHERSVRIESDANNTDERVSLITFGVAGGGEAEQITTGGVTNDPPDVSGNVAVFERGNDIWMVDLQSKVETQLTATTQRELNPRISGSHVVFMRDEGDSAFADIYLYDLSTGTETRLTDHPGKQVDPDVSGDTVVWQDERAGATAGDIYRYVIGSSSINGELLVDLGAADLAAYDPRIDTDYVAYSVRDYTTAGDPFSPFLRDFGYYDLGDGSQHSTSLLDQDPCNAGNLFDVSGPHLAFECDCGPDACDRDDMIYYVDMDARSNPVRLTCDMALGDDREEPSIQGTDVLYKLDGDLDIYQVAIGSGCDPSAEIPLHVGPHSSRYPAGDANEEAYVFVDNRTGSYQLWGVLPPPAVDVAVASFFFDDTEFFQEDSYSFQVLVRNDGQDPVTDLQVSVTDDGALVHQETIASLAAGAATTLSASWSTAGSSTGVHELRAFLDPAPAGDANPTNDERSLELDVEDDDVTPPTVSQATASPGSGDDGDEYIEEDEAILVTWMTSDPKGISSTIASFLGTDYPGTHQGGDLYSVELPNPGAGTYQVSLVSTDADDSPSSSLPISVPFTVYPAFPEVTSTQPIDGAIDVDTRVVLEAFFSVDMDSSSITDQTFLLRPAGGGPSVAATVTYSTVERKASLEPVAALQSGGAYEAELVGGAGGLRDVRQNPLPSDVIFSFTTADEVSPRVIHTSSVEDTGDGELADLELTSAAISQLVLTFSEPMLDPAGDSDPADVTRTANYLLVDDGGDDFDTLGCTGGAASGDVEVALDAVTYDAGSGTASLEIAAAPLGDGTYRLWACPGLQDESGNALDGDGDGTGGDEFSLTFLVDRTPPAPPSVLESTSHQPSVWSTTRIVDVVWSDASGTGSAGINGYSWIWDTLDSTTPDTSLETPHGADPHGTSSPSLEDGGDHWFHLRSCDALGQCSTPVHLGPFQIDTVAPSDPTILSSPSHDPDSWSNDPAPQMAWQDAADSAGSGVDGYSVEFFTPDLLTAPEFQAAWGPDGSDPGEMMLPSDVATVGAECAPVFAVDSGNHRIQSFDGEGRPLTSFGAPGTGDGQFTQPAGIAVDALGFIYVSDEAQHRIQRFDSAETFVASLGAPGTDDGQLDQPGGLALDAAGHLFVADRGNHRLQRFATDGTFIEAWGQFGSGDGQFNQPVDVAVARSGDVFVADLQNHRIQAFDSDGNFLTSWGTFGSGQGEFKEPAAVAIDLLGRVYVADRLNARIQVFTSDGTYLTQWGAPGDADGELSSPGGLAACGLAVFAADTGNHRLQKFSPPPPDGVIDVAHTTDPHEFFPAPLSDGANHVFQLRTCDQAGNCTRTAYAGPYRIDTVPPPSPDLTPVSHTVGMASSAAVIELSISQSDDEASGVTGFSSLFSSSDADACPQTADLDAGSTTLTSPPLADGSWYAHLCTVDEAGNWSAQTVVGPFLIDSAPPSPPQMAASTSHSPSTWSNSNQIGVQWSEATDTGPASLAGYSVAVDEQTSTIPDSTVDVPHDADPHSLTTDPLADGQSHHVHLRSCDDAGNCGDAAHLGPFWIDTVPPGLPSGVTSTNHAPGAPSSDPQISMTWNLGSDALSGVDGHAFAFTPNSTPVCDQALDVEENVTTATSPPLADGSWWFHLCTVDNAGNWTQPVSSGPFVIDTTSPTGPTTLESTSHTLEHWSNERTLELRWIGASDGASGVDGYSFLFDNQAATVPDTTADLAHGADPQLVTSSPVDDGQSHYFHLRTCDVAGNCSPPQHLGPFWVDATSPSNPGDVASTSHDVGTSTDVTSIDIGWSSGSDAASGLDGYGYAFTQSASWTCDEVADLGAGASSVSSQPLADGSWWFHLCATDVAGNWSEPESVGPFEIATPPRVTRLRGVASRGKDLGSSTQAAVTQILVTFDVEVFGADLASSYRLLQTGANGTFETTDCELVQGDDLELTLAQAAYDAPSQTAAVQVDSGPLANGQVRFLACQTIADAGGLALDGDGNGVAGGDLVHDISISVHHLLQNPNFDDDLGGWSISSPSAGEIAYGDGDRDDAFSSGSVRVDASSGPSSLYSVSQCVGLSPGNAGGFAAARARITSSSSVDPTAAIRIEWFSSSNCTGSAVDDVLSAVLLGDTGGDWSPLATDLVPAPGAGSARWSLTIDSGALTEFSLEGDDFEFFDHLIFADGFESGDTGEW